MIRHLARFPGIIPDIDDFFRERFFCKPCQANLTIWTLNFGTPPWPRPSRCGVSRSDSLHRHIWKGNTPTLRFIPLTGATPFILFPCFAANLGKMYEDVQFNRTTFQTFQVEHHHLLGFTQIVMQLDAFSKSQQTVELGTGKRLYIWWDRILIYIVHCNHKRTHLYAYLVTQELFHLPKVWEMFPTGPIWNQRCQGHIWQFLCHINGLPLIIQMHLVHS